MYEINNNDSNFIIFLKTELNKLEKDYGKDYLVMFGFNFIMLLLFLYYEFQC